MDGTRGSIRLGLRPNLGQFSLLVLVNAFVGSMVGLERTVVPLIGEREFGIVSKSAILSFIITFGVVKAFCNLHAGRIADAWGRKRVLVLGWLVGIPVPFLILWAPRWEWIAFANVLLAINQGLAWSMTVVMKIDLVGPARRGLALGLNESAGYLSVSLTALATGYIAQAYALRPHPLYLGVVTVTLGLLASVFLVRETQGHALLEARQQTARPAASAATAVPSQREIFLTTSWRDRALFACSQAGLVNNLNDGMAWGLFPLFFAARGLDVGTIGLIAATYPGTWGLLQVATGPLSDRWGRKGLIAWGMVIQAAGIWVILLGSALPWWLLGSAMLGLGTASVYPTLLAAVSDVAAPAWRARALGVYRFWRDMGYALGALLSGVVADLFGVPAAMHLIAALTLWSGLVVARTMYETLAASGRAPAREPVAAAPSR